MRRLVLAVLLLTLSAIMAFGEVQDFGKFTLDIPQNWTAEYEDLTVNINKNDDSSSMSITYSPTDGYSIEDLLHDWRNMEDDASELKHTSDGYYTYTYKAEDGKKTTSYIRTEEDGKMYLSVDMTGKDTKTMTAIMNSFALKGAPKKPEAKTETRYYNENTALILAAFQGETENVKKFLQAGSDVNARNIYGMTALMYAAEGNHSEIARILLQAGAEINAQNNEGSTSLIIAAIHGSVKAINVLLEAGADIDIKNDKGKTAADYARENETLKDNTDIIERLETRG
ncbi:MAG: ankyrin repeat domain-containing protein [Synergistaceae bacterium]|nr:ankyrin repeat domain-containing protein [Synergistaceae bacterium]